MERDPDALPVLAPPEPSARRVGRAAAKFTAYAIAVTLAAIGTLLWLEDARFAWFDLRDELSRWVL